MDLMISSVCLSGVESFIAGLQSLEPSFFSDSFDFCFNSFDFFNHFFIFVDSRDLIFFLFFFHSRPSLNGAGRKLQPETFLFCEMFFERCIDELMVVIEPLLFIIGQ